MDGLSGNGSGTCGAAAGETVASDVTGTCQSDGSHLKSRLHPARHGFMDRTRYEYAASRSFRLKAGGDVHAIPVEVVTLDDQVAQVKAHTEHKRSICWLVAIGLGHGLLKLDGGAQRIDCAGELDQGAVAGQLDQTPSIFGQNGIE